MLTNIIQLRAVIHSTHNQALMVVEKKPRQEVNVFLLPIMIVMSIYLEIDVVVSILPNLYGKIYYVVLFPCFAMLWPMGLK